MDGFTQQRRGLFDGLKVPALDLNAIVLAALAILSWKAGLSAVAWIDSAEIGQNSISTGQGVPLATTMLGNILAYFGASGHVIAEAYDLPTAPQKLKLIHYLGFFGWSLVIWAFFSAALNRIAAMKLAREEGLEFVETLKFASSKFVTNIFTIVFVLSLVGILYGLCNATIGGSVSAVPYLGDLFLMVLFWLILGSTFLIVFCLALGLLGFNMASSAIATESSDAFDGISRSWNYILSKPWAFLISNLLIVAYITLFLTFGGLFLKIAVSSLSMGNWGLGNSEIVIAGNEAVALMGGEKNPEALTYLKTELVLPGKGAYIYNRVIVGGTEYEGRFETLHTASKVKDNTIISRRVFKRQYMQLQRDGTVIDVLPAIKKKSFFFQAGEAVNGWIMICQILMYAYAVNYFFAGQTTIYFMLRKEVDGDDYNEIIIGDEDDNDLFDLPSYPGGNKPSSPPDNGGNGGDNKDPGSGGDNKDPDSGGDKKSLPMVMEV
jgi:hypothetical protein